MARLMDRAPGLARGELVDEIAGELKAGFQSFEGVRVADAVVDGLPALRVEGTGTRHMRVKTQDEVSMNAQAYLRDQEAKNPNRGIYTVMARQDVTGRNPSAYVVMQEAQYAEFDARTVNGVVLVPMREKHIRVSYEYDASDSSTGEAAVKEFLDGLRVRSRSRPVDRLGYKRGLAQAGVLAAGFGSLFLLVL
jgi:hypothetical protein